MTASTHRLEACAGDELARLATSLAARRYVSRGVPMSDEMIRVVLVDDHALVRDGVRLILQAVPDVSVVGDAESGETALPLILRLAPHLVVLDLDMPGGDGVWLLRELQCTMPTVRVLVLSMFGEQERLVPLLSAGARGYLTKAAMARDLVEAIRVVASGDVYVRPSVARLLASAVVPQPTAATARARFETLSDRERTILRMVAQGWSGAEIARSLGISTKTVDAYKHRVGDKLGLAHRTEFVRFAVEAGVLGTG